MSLKTQERRKYRAMWSIPDYRKFAPGENHADDILNEIKKPCKVVDFGAGTGRGALKIHQAGYPVVMIDLADNCLDKEVEKALNGNFQIMEGCLWDPIYVKGDYGYCTDVMEHIPPEKVDAVLDNITRAVPHGYFNISTIQDSFGKIIGEPLHLTVMPWDWWVSEIMDRVTITKVKIGPGWVSIWF